MSENRDIRDPGESHRYGVIAAVAAAVLTLLAAIIGLITVLVNSGESSGSSARTPSAITEASETGGGEKPAKGSANNGEASLDPAHDGNSRASAKQLPGDQTVNSSLVAGNDEDWYVYEAPKDETATVEVATTGEEAYSRIISATLLEGSEEIETSNDATSDEPFAVPRQVAAGVRLFVRVWDSCGDLGCSIGPYRVVVRTSPPG
jgi:hypothetical protein